MKLIDLLKEQNHKIGDEKNINGKTHIITDIDPETKSITWSIQNNVKDEEIYKEISNLIKKLEDYHIKNFHRSPKLIQLVKDLKNIRNRFSRAK